MKVDESVADLTVVPALCLNNESIETEAVLAGHVIGQQHAALHVGGHDGLNPRHVRLAAANAAIGNDRVLPGRQGLLMVTARIRATAGVRWRRISVIFTEGEFQTSAGMRAINLSSVTG